MGFTEAQLKFIQDGIRTKVDRGNVPLDKLAKGQDIGFIGDGDEKIVLLDLRQPSIVQSIFYNRIPDRQSLALMALSHQILSTLLPRNFPQWHGSFITELALPWEPFRTAVMEFQRIIPVTGVSAPFPKVEEVKGVFERHGMKLPTDESIENTIIGYADGSNELGHFYIDTLRRPVLTRSGLAAAAKELKVESNLPKIDGLMYAYTAAMGV